MEKHSSAFPLAFGALLAAFGAALMTAGGLIPVATYCSPLLAALLLVPAAHEGGSRLGWSVWAVTAALSLMLSVDKEAAAMYVFLGWYPLIKPALDRLRPRLLGLAAKLALFAAALTVMYALLVFLFQLEDVIEELGAVSLAVNALYYALLLVVLLLYDFILARLAPLYVFRLRPRLGNRMNK